MKIAKRFTQHVLNGSGLIATGYWVDWHDRYAVRQIYTGVFELTKFECNPETPMVMDWIETETTIYTDRDMATLLNDMRRIAPLTRWYEHPADAPGRRAA